MCLFLIYFGVSGTNCAYKKALTNIKAKKWEQIYVGTVQGPSP